MFQDFKDLLSAFNAHSVKYLIVGGYAVSFHAQPRSTYRYTYSDMIETEVKPVRWIGSSRKDVKSFPQPVRVEIGYALYAAQRGETDPAAKPLKGFGGRGVLEIVTDHRGDTWRSVYTVRFQSAVYVLHAFQKKSKNGISTPKKELELIRQRLADAEHDYRERQN
jgi:phage-related protein